MSLLTKRLSLDKQKKDNEALTFSFAVSICWHICLFSIFFITLPGSSKLLKTADINFIGSFLKIYDFDSGGLLSFGRKDNKYLQFAKGNVPTSVLADYAKLPDELEKPRSFFFTKFNAAEYIPSSDERFLNKNFSIKDEVSREKGFLIVKDLPDVHIFFKEGIPAAIKFDLYINEKGRVNFLNKLITSGNFDADMALQRALIRQVFDTYHFGYIHRRALELDLKNDRY